MKKRIISIMILICIILTTACSSGSKTESLSNEGSPIVAIGTGEKLSPPDVNENKKLNIYSWSSDFEFLLQSFYEKYPQYKECVQYTNVGDYNIYYDEIDLMLNDKDSSEYPGLFLVKGSELDKYVNNEKTASFTDLGITVESCANMYPYTLERSYDENGQLKTLTDSVIPKAFFYNEKIAQEILGVSTSEEVAEIVCNWDTFIDTLRTFKEKSDGKYGAFCPTPRRCMKVENGEMSLQTAIAETIKDLFFGYYEESTLQYGSYTFSDNTFDYLKYAKLLIDEELVSTDFKNSLGTFLSEDGYYNDFLQSDDIDKDETDGSSYWRNWIMCTGPACVSEESCYYFITKDCSYPELAAFIIQEMCTNTEIMANTYKQGRSIDGLYGVPNNKEILQNGTKLLADSIESSDFDPYKIYDKIAGSIVLHKNICDYWMENHIDQYLEKYVEGTISNEEIMENLVRELQNDYPFINLE